MNCPLRTFILVLSAIAANAQKPDYFPPGIFSPHAVIEEMVSEDYSSQLMALKERSLWRFSREQPAGEAYRFLLLRSFDHPIAIYLAIHKDGTGTLTAKEADFYGGSTPGRLIRNRQRKLTEQQVQLVRTRLKPLNLWGTPTRRRHEPTGLDGSMWVVEGARQGNYDLLQAWSPAKEHPIHDLGLLLLSLGEIQIPPDKLY